MQPHLFRGHVQMQWPFPRTTTCNQGTVGTCFVWCSHLYSEDNLILGRGRWNYLFLDLGQTKAYKVKPGVFGVHTYERPPMLKCPCPSAFRQSKWQELHLEATFLGYYALCTLTRGRWGGTGVSSYTGVLFSGCRDLLSWSTTLA